MKPMAYQGLTVSYQTLSSFFILVLCLLLLLGRPLFRSLWELMVASARSNAGMNPRSRRRFAPEGEIWEMEIRNTPG